MAPINFGPLRQQSIYGTPPFFPEPGPTYPYTPPVFPDQPLPPEAVIPPAPQEFDVNQILANYKPETEMTERFSALMGKYPKRNKPGFWRKLGASTVALGKGGLPASERALYGPFYQELEDWKRQIEPAYQAANLERYQNVNERQLAYQTAQAGLRERDIARKERADEERARIANEKNNLARLKYENPNLRFDFSGPEVLVADPSSGKVTKTGVKTGDLTELDKLNLQQQHALARIGATGTEARKTEETRQEGREVIQEMRGWSDPVVITGEDGVQRVVTVNRESGETKEVKFGGKAVTGTGEKPPIVKPGTPGSKEAGGLSPQEQKVNWYNKAQQLRNSFPHLQKWIVLGKPGTNDFEIRKPSSFLGYGTGPSKEDYDAMVQYIYGGKQVPQAGTPQAEGTVSPQLRQKAVDYLNKNNMPATEANINHAIKTGRVK